MTNTLSNTRKKYNLVFNVSETALLILFLMVWTSRILLTYVRAGITMLPVIGFWADGFIIVAYVVMLVFSLPLLLKRLKYSDVFLGLAVLLVCLLNFWIYPENVPAIEEHLGTFLFFTFPLYYLGVAVDFKKIYPWIYRLSILSIFAYTVYKLFFTAPMDDIQSLYEGDMWGAYNLLPHVCVVAVHMFKKASVINVAASVVGFIMLISLGSRGPLICFIVAIELYLMFFKEYQNKILSRGIILLVSLLIIIFMDDIMMFFYEITLKTGLSIRVFDKYFGGSFAYSSGRDAIQNQLMTLIGENPALGYGMYSDYTAIGIYAHNIILELWMDFGVFVGSGIFAAFIVIFLKSLKAVKAYKEYILLLLPLFAAGFIKLFMSNSYLEDMYLFLLIGICVGAIRQSERTDSNG